jgi:uncharacterized protein YdeI (YjbR/CyaY-like superfamily)
MVEITETLLAKDRKEWMEWLERNHSSKKEIWLILYKKHVSKTSVSYEDAVEEALCWGWIDGILKRIDDEKHTIRFSPRRRTSIWSESNLERVERMISQGRMRSPGLEIYEARDKERYAPSVKYRGAEVEVPQYIQNIFKEDREVWRMFLSFPPSHKNQYIGWIETAKREETRFRRARKAVEMIRNEKRSA